MSEENRELKDAYHLRLPDGWRATLKARAAQHGRTLNSEILQLLKPTVEKEMSIQK